MKIDSVEFVRSANGASDLPTGDLPELAMVGRSNVGKSTLINALLKQPIARTSATPGKTRLINLFRVVTPPTGPFYLVDLPGYGYSRGPAQARDEFDRLAQIYFSRAEGARAMSEVRGPRSEVERRAPVPRHRTSDIGHRTSTALRAPRAPVEGRTSDESARPGVAIGVFLLVDARHPGVDSDLATCEWLHIHGLAPVVVVTKLDKLSRTERAKTLRTFEHLMKGPVVAVSARTGEGLDDLWKPIASWVTAATARHPHRSHP